MFNFKFWDKKQKEASEEKIFSMFNAVAYSSVAQSKALHEIALDDEIINCWQKRVRSVLARDYRLEGSNDKDIALIEKSLENILSDYANIALNAILFGDGYQQVLTETIAGSIYAKEALEIPRNLVMWQNLGMGNEYLTAITVKGTVRFDAQPSLYAHFYKRSYSHISGHGLLRDLQCVYNERCQNLHDLAEWSKRYSQGFIITGVKDAGFPESITKNGVTTETTRGQQMLDTLKNAARGAALVTDKEDSVTVWQPNGTGSDFYLNNDARLRKQIQKMILGESKTSGDDKGGSFASDKVANEVREEVTDSDINFVRSYIQDLINRLCDANRIAKPPQIIFEHDSETNETKAAYIKTLSDAGVKITQKGLADLMGFDAEQFTIAADTVTPTPESNATTPTPALKMQATLAQNSRFTPAQQRIEAIADDAIGEFIDNKAEIIQAIMQNDSKDGIIDAINALDAPDFSKIEEFIKKAIKQGADDVDNGVV